MATQSFIVNNSSVYRGHRCGQAYQFITLQVSAMCKIIALRVPCVKALILEA